MSTFIAFFKTILKFFISSPQIFFKDFIKERRYLHFICSILIVLPCLLFGYKYMDLENVPIVFIIFLGAFGAFVINWLREGYYEQYHNAFFDYLDVYAGAYGGIAAAIIYLIII